MFNILFDIFVKVQLRI